jgi:hypothetical protein
LASYLKGDALNSGLSSGAERSSQRGVVNAARMKRPILPGARGWLPLGRASDSTGEKGRDRRALSGSNVDIHHRAAGHADETIRSAHALQHLRGLLTVGPAHLVYELTD